MHLRRGSESAAISASSISDVEDARASRSPPVKGEIRSRRDFAPVSRLGVCGSGQGFPKLAFLQVLKEAREGGRKGRE